VVQRARTRGRGKVISAITAAAAPACSATGCTECGAEVPSEVASGVGPSDPERLRRRG